MHKFLSIVLLSVLFIGPTSCYKVHHNYIVKTEWYLNALELDGGSTNFMNGILPDYIDGGGYYKIYMLDNGLSRGEYYVYDTLNYFVTGTWDLLSPDSIRIELDDYVEGTFFIELVDMKEMILSTNHNNVKFFGIGDVKAVVRCSKGETTSQGSTTP
jgi:hypothetical protein